MNGTSSLPEYLKLQPAFPHLKCIHLSFGHCSLHSTELLSRILDVSHKDYGHSNVKKDLSQTYYKTLVVHLLLVSTFGFLTTMSTYLEMSLKGHIS